MSNLESANRATKGHARDSIAGKMVLNIDLNFPPAECLLFEETSGSRHPQISRGARQPCHSTGPQQGASAPSSSFIDLAGEVVTLSSSRGFPTGRTRSRRMTVFVEEDREINLTRSVIVLDDQVASSSFTTCKKRFRSSTSRETVNCDLYPDTEEEHGAKRKAMIPEVVNPTFICPICLDKMDDPASTICGHIFCLTCTKASIQAQKKCPTCRRKLTMKSFHRIYLPVQSNS